jgi:hypothetical protein
MSRPEFQQTSDFMKLSLSFLPARFASTSALAYDPLKLAETLPAAAIDLIVQDSVRCTAQWNALLQSHAETAGKSALTAWQIFEVQACRRNPPWQGLPLA